MWCTCFSERKKVTNPDVPLRGCRRMLHYRSLIAVQFPKRKIIVSYASLHLLEKLKITNLNRIPEARSCSRISIGGSLFHVAYVKLSHHDIQRCLVLQAGVNCNQWLDRSVAVCHNQDIPIVYTVQWQNVGDISACKTLQPKSRKRMPWGHFNCQL